MPPAEIPDSASPVLGTGDSSHSLPPSMPPAVDDPASTLPTRTLSPPQSSFLSAPIPSPYPSPLRQHRRTPSQHREIKETLNAVSEIADDEEDGFSHHKINQYTIKGNIGRGSYGDVHIAIDQYGKEYAVKQFSKARMRRRVRSNIMKQGPFRPGRYLGASGPFGPASRFDGEAQAEAKDALHLIREEIAIMKKLDHPNLVELIEVLDDPEEDSLYMVLEMCKKGVIMDVGLEKTAEPYDAEACRCWFRDLILGIEYLHAQNIIHRDIKPDNLLVTEDDVLKIGDFGVSEIFEKPDRMRTSKIAGSPAFLPPELCVSNHGDVAGPPCDIWSMGVTLYCLRYGKIPFNYATVPEIYEAINNAKIELPDDEDELFVDILSKIFEKDPAKRITMAEMREHPWVTMNGIDPLLSVEENCAHHVEPPNALELSHAFTRNMGNLLCVMKAIGKFKGLLNSRGGDSSLAGPSVASEAAHVKPQPLPVPTFTDAGAITTEEVTRLVQERRDNIRKATLQTNKAVDMAKNEFNPGEGHVKGRESGTGIGTDRPTLLLGIGTGGTDDFGAGEQQVPGGIVSESPTAADFDVYDCAFQSEINRIQSQDTRSTVYLNKILERRKGAIRFPPDYSTKTSRTSQEDLLDDPGTKETVPSTETAQNSSSMLAEVVALAMKESKS